MIDISRMSDEDKSKQLAKMIGYQPWFMQPPFTFSSKNPFWLSHVVNFYDTGNFSLVWFGVLKWVSRGADQWRSDFYDWFKASTIDLMGEEYAQRYWLDKILVLAIEAGEGE